MTILINMAHPIFSQKQSRIYYEPLKDFNLFWGKTGTGKTFSTNLRFYKEICNARLKSNFILSGNTIESLYDNVITDLLTIDSGIGWLEYKTVASRQRLIVKPTGTRVKCVGANNARAGDRIQGGNEDGWYADEIIKQPKSFTEMAISRCRKDVDGTMMTSPIIWTFNPDSPSHYIKLEYFDKLSKMNGQEIWFDFKDNPLIYDETTGKYKGDYVDRMANRFSGVFKERMFHGRWSLAEGVIYDKFNRDVHIVDEYPIGQVKEYAIGVDWGYAHDHPLAIGLWAITDQAYYCIDEIYIEQQLIDKTLIDKMRIMGWYKLPITWKPEGEFVKKQADITKPDYAYCDDARPDLMAQFHKLSGITTLGACKDVEDGIQAVQRKFIKQGDGSYGMYFLRKCVNHIREFELYAWDRLLSGMGKNVPKKVNDHCPDETRYVVYTRERGKVKMIDKRNLG